MLAKMGAALAAALLTASVASAGTLEIVKQRGAVACGVSTGLPEQVQEAFIRTIEGLEKVAFIRYGYSIEHAVVRAEELRHTLESRRVPGLFFAGQPNGTTG